MLNKSLEAYMLIPRNLIPFCFEIQTMEFIIATFLDLRIEVYDKSHISMNGA